MGALLVLTLISFIFVFAAERDREKQDREALQTQAAAAVRLSVARLTSRFVGASAIANADGSLDRRAFRSFARDQLIQGPLLALALERVVPAKRRRAFEQSIGGPITDLRGRKLVRAPAREVYFAVEDIYPRSRTNGPLIGFDIAASPLRGLAATAARDEGRPRLSGRVPLASNGKPGVLVVQPIYRPGLPLRTVADRRRAAVGFISSGFNLGELQREVAEQLPRKTILRITDGRDVIVGPASGPVQGISIRVGGRRWNVGATNAGTAGQSTAWLLLGAGLLLTLLASALFIQSLRRELSLLQSQQDIRRARDATAGLQRLTSALSRAMLPAEIADAMATIGLPLLRASGFALYAGALPEPGLRLVRAEGDEGSVAAPVLHGDEPHFLADAVRTERGVWTDSAAEAAAGAAEAMPDTPLAAHAVALPLLSRGEVIGVLALSYATTQAFDDVQRAYVEAVGVQCAQALERARLAEAEHELARSLQNSLLPRHLPAVHGIELAARYEPADSQIDLGGDWYDAIELPEGRIGIAVGDVVGHGAAAAAIMGQLRSAFRAFAIGGAAPAEIIGALSEFAERLDGAEATTLVYAILSPADGALTYCVAGHPPPLHVTDDGSTYLDGGRSVPIGIGGLPYLTADAHVAPGETILLYSDGLIERRANSLDEGLERLARAASVIGPDANGLTSLLPERLDVAHEDDIVILAITLTGVTSPAKIPIATVPQTSVSGESS